MSQPPFQPFGGPGEPPQPPSWGTSPSQPFGTQPFAPQPSQPQQQPYVGQPAYGVPPYGAPTRPTVDGAVAALVCGILGLVFCPLLSIPGIVMGRRAMRRCDASGGYYDGRGLAQAGFITGLVGALLWGAFIAFYVVLIVIIGTGGGFSDLDSAVGPFARTGV